MNILLIAPSSGPWQQVAKRHLFTGKTFRFSLLGLLSVAAETPAEHNVRIVDEQVEPIPFNAEVDVVGIGFMTALAPRAYEIADCFRARGVPVVFGGMHPTLCPDEAGDHADAIVLGDAEGIWPQVLADVAAGALHARYRAPERQILRGLKAPPRQLLDTGKYAMTYAVQATRGCPHGCDFCAVSAFHHACQKQRPVAEVAAEVARIPGQFLLFVDDNLTADREYASRLFEALAPLGKRWVTQSTLAIADDPAFCRQAAAAGCVGLFVGMETFREENLEGVNKTCHKVQEYRHAVDLLHSLGIGVEAGIVFGFDGDRTDVFAATLRHLEELAIDAAQISILTPLPGTPAHDQMADRLLTRDWSQYDFHHAVFRPAGMTAGQLKQGHDWITREFYQPWRIARRVLRHLRRPNGLHTAKYVLGLNAAYWGRTRSWGIRGADPARRPNVSGEPVWNAQM
jgi:radical SAM superfamily enzyme YgiQ (UPF0313 family)